MLCLRRISLDAKSRLLFLSRSHSSTNDSMPKSTAISRLIHKKFLQQNGNNSPQAIFVFFQKRGIRIIADKKKSHAKGSEDEFEFGPSGMKPKNEWEEGLYKFLHKYFAKPRKSEMEFEKMLKEIDLDKKKRELRTEVPEDKDKSSEDPQYDSDAKDSKDEFKFGFGPSGMKPKNEWEKGLYRILHKYFMKPEKSEVEFEKMLKEIDLVKIRRYFFNDGLVTVGILALIIYAAWKTISGAGVVTVFYMYNVWKTFERYVILWTKVPEFKFGFGPSGAKPKNKWEESLYRALKESFVKSGKSEKEFEKYLKSYDFAKIQQYSIIVGRDLAFTYMSKSADSQEKSDAIDSEDEFKFGIGPFGAKPKNNFEKDVYRYLHKDFMKSGKSEEEFEIWLKLFDLDLIRLNAFIFSLYAVTVYCLKLGAILASITFIVSMIFVEPIVPMFFVFFIALPVWSFFCIRAEYNMKSGTK